MSNPPGSHQPNEFSIRFVVFAFVGLVVIVAGSMLLMAWMFRVLASDAPTPRTLPRSLAETRDVPPSPQLNPQQRQVRETQLAIENETLASYEWLDTNDGIARIPIDRAMEILVEENEK